MKGNKNCKVNNPDKKNPRQVLSSKYPCVINFLSTERVHLCIGKQANFRGSPLKQARYTWTFYVPYILVQQSITVSLAGLPVLRTLYKPLSMHKSTNSQNCEFCVFIKVVAFK